MGYSVYCNICGLMTEKPKSYYQFNTPLVVKNKNHGTWDDKRNIELYEKFVKSVLSKSNTNWLDKCGVIDENGKYISNVIVGQNFNSTVHIKNSVKTYEVVYHNEKYNNDKNGILVHYNCYQKIKKIKKKNENLYETYKHFIPEDGSLKHLQKVFTKKRTDHWYQYPIFHNGKKFILNKLDFDKTSDYPIKVYKRIKKYLAKRKSPVLSATDFHRYNSTKNKVTKKKMIGLDGNKYGITKISNSYKWSI
jgi:hypothetical protein